NDHTRINGPFGTINNNDIINTIGYREFFPGLGLIYRALSTSTYANNIRLVPFKISTREIWYNVRVKEQWDFTSRNRTIRNFNIIFLPRCGDTVLQTILNRCITYSKIRF